MTRVNFKYGIKTDIDKITGKISQESKIGDKVIREIYDSQEVQLSGALIRLGWLPPDASAEVIEVLNSLIRIGKPETNMFREQFDLNEYKALAKRVLNIESPVINRYLIRRKK